MQKIFDINDSLPPDETPVLVKYNDKWRVLELAWERPSWEETYSPFRFWQDPYDEGLELDWDSVTEWCYLPGEELQDPLLNLPVPLDESSLDDETMTDGWLAHQMHNSYLVAKACHAPADQLAAVFRSFANRVLLKFGGDKSASALAIPFTMSK